MNVSSCTVAWVVALALLGGSLLTCSVSQSEHDKLKKVFSEDLIQTYTNIVHERRNHYLQGLALGAVLATAVLWAFRPAHRVVTFFAVSLFTGVLYYRLMPKSDYMLNHLKTPEQNRAWLEMYKTMQSRYVYGMLLGAGAALALAYAMCG
jgi:hypothetical protein